MVKTVGVVGAGTMGNGIAQAFAQSGFDVRLHDASAAAMDRARSAIEKSLGKFVEKGKIDAADRDATLGRLQMLPALDDLAAVDFVVEAIVERADVKRDLFAKLDALTRSEVILTSNTSSISITTLGAVRTQRYTVCPATVAIRIERRSSGAIRLMMRSICVFAHTHSSAAAAASVARPWPHLER